ncbi:ankyrin repeat domain-containing protein [bacterium]|nr:ankyrin repeat domain-containing protein [bacterium]
MKFNAETQRLEHPQARLIPQPLWDALFKNELTDTEMMLLQADMTQDQEHILEALQDLSPIYTFSGDQKLRAGVCILLGHPEYREALIQNAETLTLSPDDLLNIAVMTSRNDLISSIIAKYPNTKNWLGSAFLNACRIGNIEALEQLAAYSPEDVYAMIEYKDYKALVNAAKNNQLPVMTWLMQKLAPDERQEMLVKSHAFSDAARNGHLSAMEWLLSHLDDVNARSIMIEGYEYNAFNDAAENGLEKLLVERLSPASIRKAKSKLSQCGDAGNAIINEINCLQRGSKSSWSALWAGAEEKLAGIISALNSLPNEKYDENFIHILEDQDSALFQALFKPLSATAEPADAKLLDEIKLYITQFGSSAQL